MNIAQIRILLFLLSSLVLAQPSGFVKYNTMGFDLELLSYGGSLGGFYNFHPSEAITLGVETDWVVVEGADTFSYYDFYNQPVVINNQNLSFVKLLAGVSWFPFIESMHSSVQVGGFASAGPLLSMNTADDEGFTERWKDVETDLAPMVRSGIHVKIITGQGSSYTFKLGYDYASFNQKIDSRQTYEGVFLQAGVEFLHR